MTYKSVTIEYNTAHTGDEYHYKMALTETFLGVAGQCRDVEISLKDGKFKFTVGRDTFRSLADDDLLPTPIVNAFIKADQRLSDHDKKRTGFLARLFDSFFYSEAIMRGIPVVTSPQGPDGMRGINVSVHRYGLAPKRQI